MNDFYEILDNLIIFNKQYRPKDAKIALSPVHYLKEFCTVSVNPGRGVGKTSYILDRAKNGDLVIVPPFVRMAHLYAQIVPMNLGLYMLGTNTFRGERYEYETIYVDEPNKCFVEMDFYEFLRRIAVPEIEQTIVCLGGW
jgi:hypothetical protein